jgi:pimeloyl-ACP methyl ester carboxylesterase
MKINRRRFIKTSAVASMGLTGFSLSSCVSGGGSGVRPAPLMPEPEFVSTNGLRMAVYEKGEGPAIVFCHGFPELAFSWRNQIDALSDAGFRAIAPDQRGYGLTGGPADPTQYDMQFLCDDLVGMLDAKGLEKAVFCGHDWGGAVVWSMPRLHPDRCLGVIGLNTAAGRPADLPPLQNPEQSLIVMSPNFYQATFIPPGRAEAILEADVRHTFNFILSRGGIWNREEFARMPEDSPERQMDLLTLIQRENLDGEVFMSEQVMQYFADTFEATGFTGGLNWYRNAFKMGQILANTPTRINVPCLYIGAENDVILPPSSADGMEDFIADLEKHTVMDSGHWTQQEQPEEVNRVIVDWMRRKIA